MGGSESQKLMEDQAGISPSTLPSHAGSAALLKKDNSTKHPTAYQARNVVFLQLWGVISAVWVYSVSF